MGTKRKATRAFTLLEIMIATAILSMLVVALAQIASFVASAWTTGGGNAERRENGRALTDFIGQELRSAIAPVSAIGTSANLQFISNPPATSNANSVSSTLFWQAPVATATTYGDLAEVGYFVRWSTVNKVPVANLCRFFVNPGDANYLIYTNTSWITDDLLNKVAPADKNSGYVGLFAENVIGFWARCFKADGTEIATAHETFDSKVTTGLPAKVEVSLVLLDSHAAIKMTSGLQAKLVQIVQNATNATDGVTAIHADPTLKVISAGARAYTTVVYLENSK